MFLPDFLFYILSAVLLASALVVVTTRNTIHSVMFLILAFFNAAGLFVLLGAEFLAMLLVIVYVGAIAVLFLFVVMMLNVDDKRSKGFKEFFNRYSFAALVIGAILLVEIIFLLQSSTIAFDDRAVKSLAISHEISNTESIGNVLYTDYIYPFQLAGMVLFVAMIGAIVLTLRDKDRFIRKQVIADQVDRTKPDAVELVKVESGKGIDV